MAETRSEGSRNSGNSGRRYRVVSRGSNVDDTLFGDPKAKRLNSGSKAIKHVTSTQIPPSAGILTMKELEDIKSRANIMSAAEEAAERERKERLSGERQQAANERKARMLKMAEESKASVKRSELEIESVARDTLIKALAAEKIDDNNDLVKMLNSLGARAAAFTIRDKQLEDKKKQEEGEKDYEKRMDTLMELDRLRLLQSRDEVERAKLYKRHEDRKVVVEQIEARQRRKLLELEAREQENQTMLAVTRKYQEEDEAAMQRRADEVRRSRAEVMEANEAAIRQRLVAKEREREEIEGILAYQAQKDLEMQKRELAEAEKQRIMKERQQKLLEGQQKAMDKRQELDELRARRAAEEKERRERTRERNEAEKLRADVMQLQEDRKRQAELKKTQLAREAELEEAEYEAAVRYNAEASERERAERAAKHAASMRHRDAILTQVQEAELAKRQERTSRFEEGRRLKQAAAIEQMKLEAIRDKMVNDLEKKGFNPKYLSEMKMVDISKACMR